MICQKQAKKQRLSINVVQAAPAATTTTIRHMSLTINTKMPVALDIFMSMKIIFTNMKLIVAVAISIRGIYIKQGTMAVPAVVIMITAVYKLIAMVMFAAVDTILTMNTDTLR